MAIPVQFNFVPQDLQAICQNQTTAGSGNLTINGTYVDQNALGVGVQRAFLPGGVGYGLALQSSGNVSAVSFTAYGLDVYGQTVSASISGPNNSIVVTAQEFAAVTQISVDQAVGTNTRVGISGHGASRPYKLDTFMNPMNMDASVSIVATATAALQSTDQNLNTIVPISGAAAVVWTNLASVSNVTASTIATISSPHRYVRLYVSGANATGTVTAVCTQAGW